MGGPPLSLDDILESVIAYSKENDEPLTNGKESLVMPQPVTPNR